MPKYLKELPILFTILVLWTQSQILTYLIPNVKVSHYDINVSTFFLLGLSTRAPVQSQLPDKAASTLERERPLC